LRSREINIRKIIVIEFMTLDGVMQAPGGPEEDTSGGFSYGGWTVPYFDEFVGKIMSEQMSLERSELLLGRKTYEIFASYWPQRASGWRGINEVKKYVVSDNPSLKLDWNNSILITGLVVEKLKQLKEIEGPDLHVWGSCNLVQTLLKHELVDGLWLKIFPITLGTGKRLFGEGTVPTAFKLIKHSSSPKGVIIASYERSGNVTLGSY
jgi:dihydrofolate reductase